MSEAILKTIVYFDIFNTPLTKEEIYRWAWKCPAQKYIEFLQKLNELVEKNVLNQKYGYYFLPEREEIIDTRQRAIPIVEEKIMIAKRACKKIRWVPFVEAVFVCNTVAGGGVKKTSDIDVFIIIKDGRLWLSRFLTTLVLSIYGLRRNKKNIANKICLSFYTSDKNLDLSTIKVNDDDVYLIYWIDNLIPIYDPKNIRKQIRRKNQWIKKFIPNALQNYKTLYRWRVDSSKTSSAFRYFFEKVWGGNYGNLIEKQAKEMQKAKMKLNLMSNQNKGNLGVIITDSMLKFHENDRRKNFQEQWINKYAKTYQGN